MIHVLVIGGMYSIMQCKYFWLNLSAKCKNVNGLRAKAAFGFQMQQYLTIFKIILLVYKS